MQNTSANQDLAALIAAHTAPPTRPSPELAAIRPLRRVAQARFDRSPVWRRGLGVAA